MPHLLWTWKIYRHNPFDLEFDARQVLVRAFNHTMCDDQTIKEYFGALLSDLDWGAHHFPEGIISEWEQYFKIVEKCKNIIETRDVEKQQVQEFNYYVKLYQSYSKYVEDGRTGDFDKYCAEVGIGYKQPICIYYDE